MTSSLRDIRMGIFPTTFQCFLREAQWESRDGAGDREGEGMEEGFLPGQPKAEKCRFEVNIFTKVFIISPGHTKSAGLGPPASAGIS